MDVCASSDAEGLLTALGHNRDSSVRVSTEGVGGEGGVGGGGGGGGGGGVTSSLRRSISDKTGGGGGGGGTGPRVSRSSSDGLDRNRSNVLEFKGTSPSLQKR